MSAAVDSSFVSPRAVMQAAQGTGAQAEAARQRLVDAHEPLFRAIARRLNTSRQDWDDALQGARLGFLESVRGFDADRGTTIGTYARGFIVKRVLEATFRDRRGHCSEEARQGVCEAEPDPASFAAMEDVEDRAGHPQVRAFLRGLSETQREVACRVLIEGNAASQLARARGVSPTAICKTRDRVIAVGRTALAPLVKIAA